MADFPPEWMIVRDLPESGQSHTFVVRRSDGSDSNYYVLKRLKNPHREDYFQREIEACMALDHHNILKLVAHGRTPKGKPFLITAFCTAGSLNATPVFESAAEGLRVFLQICSGVAHAHEHRPNPIYHLDLKPENILMEGATPLVGDWGICYIENGEVTWTREGPRGSMYYCAPELRNPTISGSPALATADVYSLGKILYWLFTGDVYDGHEEDYGEAERRLVHRFPSIPQFAFIDELIAQTVRRVPRDRVTDASVLRDRAHQVLNRIEAGGRVLDLRIPQRCLFCQVGHYRTGHDQIHTGGGRVETKFPVIETRRNPPYDPHRPHVYQHMRDTARAVGLLGPGTRDIPLVLICDYCGNMQYFRFDWTSDGHGENWRP